MPDLLIGDVGHVRVFTLNRPKQLNAMDSALYISLTSALLKADTEEAVHVMLIRGAGTSFCTGADTREFEQLTPDQEERVEARAGLTYELHRVIPSLVKPVVAAVHGYAVGGGAGLALACDLAVASMDAKMGYQEIRHGLVAAVVMANLSKQVGRKAAFELLSTGRLVGAEEAARIGMINRAVPEGQAYEAALALAQQLAERPVESLQATKKLFLAVADVPLQEGLVLGRKANEAMRAYRARLIEKYGEAVKSSKAAPRF